MELYLLRHAIAVPRGTPGYPNDDRPLTDQGKERMEKAAAGMKTLIPEIEIILTSPLIRARNTATIVADAFGGTKVERLNELLPGTPVAALFKALMPHKRRNQIMLVGHEPDLSTFGSLLLGSSRNILEMKKAALCRIDVDQPVPNGTGTLLWLLPPKTLRSLR